MQENYLPKKSCNSSLFFLLLVAPIFLLSSPIRSQIVPNVDVHKFDVHLDVGNPIDNESTRKVLKVVGEIEGVSRTMHRYNERFGNDSVRAVKFVDREPDPKADDPIVKNYYDVIVGSDSVTMVHHWFTFLVRNDFNEVLYYDPKKAKTMPLDEWKTNWPASEFLGSGRSKD